MLISDNCILVESNKRARETHEEAAKNSRISYIQELQEVLDQKDKMILNAVKFMRIARSDQIAKVVYKDTKYANRYTNNKLLKLFKYGCLDRFEPKAQMGKGSNKTHYVLARPGAKLLEIKGFRPMKKLNQKWRHTVAVSDVFAGLAYKYEVYDWRQELKLNYMVGSKEFEIRPDCFAHWVMKDRDNYAFFEADLGTESQDILNKKINAYHDYFFNSNEFKQHSWQPFDNPVIIPIIFVLNDENRLKKLNNYYVKFIDKHSSKLKCHFTTFEKLI